MILIDPRVGSRELLQAIRNNGVQADLASCNIEADFQFGGNGQSGPIMVGIERKEIGDMISSIRSNRMAGSQFGGLQASYDSYRVIIEGDWRRHRRTGMIQTRRGSDWTDAPGKMSYKELVSFITTLEEVGGSKTWRTYDQEETAALICDWHHWYQKTWAEQIKLASTVYAPGPPLNQPGQKPIMFCRDSPLTVKWIYQLPGIDKRARELATHFQSPLALAQATEEFWAEINGIGRLTAKKVVSAIRGGAVRG